MKPTRTTATRMFVAPNLFKLCATTLLVFSSFILFTTTTNAAANDQATALQNAAYGEQWQKQALEGELEVFYEDYQDHSNSRLRYLLKTKNGRVELHLPENEQGRSLQSGTKVRVRGWQHKNSDSTLDAMSLSDEQDSLTVLAQDSTTTTSTATSTAALTNTLGEQPTLVLLINFQDNPVQPWTVGETREMVFGRVNDFYKENSNGQAWLNGDVQGYFTLPLNSTTCDYIGIDNLAREAAANNGIDVNSYERRIYIFPKSSGCLWSGMGTLGGTNTIAWINGSFNLNTIGHELGHNFGLHHAQKLECGNDVIGSNCISVTYGDTLDIMGEAGIEGHFGAFNKEQLGWLTPLSGEIITADADGSYLLAPYESASGGAAKELKILRGIDAASGHKLWYYLEYRQAQGFDSFLDGKSGITDGVVFRLATESDIQSSQLLDMTPASAWFDMDDAALAVGSSYSDADAGVTITTEWADASGASVYVSFSEQRCSQSSPAVTLLDNQSGGVVAGSTVSYSATVTNNNSSGCAAADFDVSAAIPAGWAATASTVNLAPGESQLVTINITSASTASEGAYEIAISAANSSDNSYQSSTVISYLLETPVAACVLGNPILSLLSDQAGEVVPGATVNYSATIISQDSGSCDAAVVDLVASVPAGWRAGGASVTIAAGGTATVNIRVTSADTAADGVYVIDVKSFNADNVSYNSTVSASYTVATPAAVCIAATPLLSVSADISGEVIAGSTVSYSATLTNQDSSACTAVSFAVSADIPAGWSASNGSVNLAPGESATVNISATSAITASDGVYSLILHAQNTVDSRYAGSAVVNYLVAAPQVQVNSAPVAINDNVNLSIKEAVLIDVLANDGDRDGDNLTIKTVSQGNKGSVEISSDGRLRYTPGKSFKGSDSFSYTISDGDKTAVATVTVSLIRVKK